ncbi:MAG: CapA family protein [Rhodospirillaceae bacterium]|nr:CapA family protein [Rhodospirillaceae bacterium]
MDRRLFLSTALSVAAAPVFAAGQKSTKVALLGQALIEHLAPDAAHWPGRAAVADALKNFDVVFSNFETSIKGPRAGTPTREALTLHAATPEVFDTLRAVHINLMSTANNHAFDFNTGGILDTIDAFIAAKMPFAGTGRTLAEAAAPAYTKNAALVAFATGKIREGGMATPTRPGVNEVRRGADGLTLPEDRDRVLNAIAQAKAKADIVIAYQHNHDWEPDNSQVPGWQRVFAKQCVDAGASIFVGHGAPLLQGIEVYKGTPLIYGLGSFIFQTEKPVGAYGPESWQTAIADCTFTGSACTSLRLVPLALNEIGLKGPEDMATRGAPSLATPEHARAILNHIGALSKPFGTAIALHDSGREATVMI